MPYFPRKSFKPFIPIGSLSVKQTNPADPVGVFVVIQAEIDPCSVEDLSRSYTIFPSILVWVMPIKEDRGKKLMVEVWGKLSISRIFKDIHC